MDDARPVHSHCLENSPFNEANNDGTEPELNRVGTHGQNGHPLFANGIDKSLDDFAKIPARQNIWKGIIKIPETISLDIAPTETVDPHYGLSLL